MFLGIFAFLVVAVIGTLLIVLLQLAQIMQHIDPEEQNEESFMNRLLDFVTFKNIQLFTGVNRDEEIPGHNHDGITELDNGMPPWLAYFFYATIIFGAVYLMHYRVLQTGASAAEEYEAEMAEAALLYKDGVKVKIELLTDASVIEAGKAIYTKNCKNCHGDLGQGLIGPNLTDEYWLHGGDIESVFNTILNGVPAKGMISWKGKLSDQQMLEVANFVKSLKGTNPPNPKAPQGEKEKE